MLEERERAAAEERRGRLVARGEEKQAGRGELVLGQTISVFLGGDESAQEISVEARVPRSRQAAEDAYARLHRSGAAIDDFRREHGIERAGDVVGRAHELRLLLV